MIGKNGIRVIYGNDPGQMVKELLEAIRPEEDIDRGALIGIKPNLVLAKPSASGATTTPEIVEGVIEYLQAKGFDKIVIMEGSWVGDRTPEAFRVCGYERLSKKYNVPLVDLQKDRYRAFEVNGMKINVCEHVAKVDYLINVPVLKGHCQTNITCALKNMKGCIPDFEKRRFHSMGLHKPIAYLNKIIKQDLIIVDGMNGDLNFEEGGNPVPMNRIIAGKDPVLVDAYAAQLMGYDIKEIPYISIAESIGVGSADLASADIVELNSDILPGGCADRNGEGKIKMRPSGRVRQLSRYIVEDSACSACYGSLIHALERLDEKGLLRRLNEKLYIGQGFRNRPFAREADRQFNVGDTGTGTGEGSGTGTRERTGAGTEMDAGEGMCTGIGIGACTSGFARCVRGCPPKARDIVEYIEKHLRG